MSATTTPRILDDAQMQAFADDGFVIVRGLFAADEVATLRDTFMAVGQDGPVPGLSDMSRSMQPGDPLARYPRMMHPHRHPELPIGPLAMRTMLDRRVGDVLQDLLGEEAVAAQSMFYFKPPGARGQDLHQDNFYLRVAPGTCIAAWTAIDDADRGNGGMVAVPGSHRLDVLCPTEADPTIFFTTHHVDIPQGLEQRPLDLQAGDVLFFGGSVIHGSYPNTSKDRFRRAFICHYLPQSATECSHYYAPLFNFAGEVVSRAPATGGGPCGELQAAVKAPH